MSGKREDFLQYIRDGIQSGITGIVLSIFQQIYRFDLRRKTCQRHFASWPVESVTVFYVSGLVGMTLRWIKSNYRLSKETLAFCQYRLMKDIL